MITGAAGSVAAGGSDTVVEREDDVWRVVDTLYRQNLRAVATFHVGRDCAVGAIGAVLER